MSDGPPVCAFFTSAGGCKWGRACRFDHSVVKLIEATGPMPHTPHLREQTREQRRTIDANLRRLGGGPKPAAATQAEVRAAHGAVGAVHLDESVAPPPGV